MQNNKKGFPLRFLLLVLAAVVIGVNIYGINAARLLGDQVPMPFGVGASVVLSGSMEPALSVGDLLILRQQESYREGEIVVYQQEGTPVVHRILALEEETVLTKGDANPSADEPIPKTALKGAVVGVIPLVGYLVWALKTPLGVIVTIAGAVLLMELSFRAEKKEKDNQNEKLKQEIRQLMQELREEENH